MARAKLIISIAFVLLLSSCTFGFNSEGYKHETMPLDEAWKYVASFDYQWDDDGYWKSPHEFVADGGGDCEDFASTLMYYIGGGELVIIYFTSGQWAGAYHAVVRFDGKYIESEMYGLYHDPSTFEIIDVYDYDTVMGYCTKYGTK